MAADNWTPVQRCCPRHPSLAALTDHLLADFTELEAAEVVQQVVLARRAVEAFGLDEPDWVDTAELICRYRLSVLAGRFDDAARLDPQSHPVRSPRRGVA